MIEFTAEIETAELQAAEAEKTDAASGRFVNVALRSLR